MKVVITAGYDRSEVAIAIAELLKRIGVDVIGFLVVTPYSISRLKDEIKRNGFEVIRKSIPRLTGSNVASDNTKTPLTSFLDDEQITYKSIKKWADVNQSNYKLIKNLNGEDVENFLKNQNPDLLIYCGGGIFRKNIIEIMNGHILNAHLGPLPEVRGINAIEWAVLLEVRKEITIHYINQGIDTGNILLRLPVNIIKGDTIEIIRDKAKVAGIEGVIRVIKEMLTQKPEIRDNIGSYRQCFKLSGTMRELLEYKLSTLP